MLCFKRPAEGRCTRKRVEGRATGDIDKDGRCRGACLGVMQLYDALFHLAWMVFMIPFLEWAGSVGGGRGGGGDERGLNQKHWRAAGTFFRRGWWQHNKSFSAQNALPDVWDWYSGKAESESACFPPNSFAYVPVRLIISCHSCSQTIHPSLTICTF